MGYLYSSKEITCINGVNYTGDVFNRIPSKVRNEAFRDVHALHTNEVEVMLYFDEYLLELSNRDGVLLIRTGDE